MLELIKDLILFIGVPLALILSIVDLEVSAKKHKVVKGMLINILRTLNNNNKDDKED